MNKKEIHEIATIFQDHHNRGIDTYECGLFVEILRSLGRMLKDNPEFDKREFYNTVYNYNGVDRLLPPTLRFELGETVKDVLESIQTRENKQKEKE
jgi:hypothetical protein|tara:strand:+ start:84 stop:371 length:288 start_codon:yes stop_codon:yes gene_type:complete